jgi:hypothetical protein
MTVTSGPQPHSTGRPSAERASTTRQVAKLLWLASGAIGERRIGARLAGGLDEGSVTGIRFNAKQMRIQAMRATPRINADSNTIHFQLQMILITSLLPLSFLGSVQGAFQRESDVCIE